MYSEVSRSPERHQFPPVEISPQVYGEIDRAMERYDLGDANVIGDIEDWKRRYSHKFEKLIAALDSNEVH